MAVRFFPVFLSFFFVDCSPNSKRAKLDGVVSLTLFSRRTSRFNHWLIYPPSLLLSFSIPFLPLPPPTKKNPPKQQHHQQTSNNPRLGLGNEHGPGSYNRFVAEPSVNPFGSYWGHCEKMQALMDDVGKGRATVVYYEHLKEDLEREVERLAEFLDLPPLTAAKMAAITKRVSLKSMSEAEGTKKLVRKGIVGDHVNHLDAQKWAAVDAISKKRLGNTPIFQPLIKF